MNEEMQKDLEEAVVEPQVETAETAPQPEESMADFAAELEESYKDYGNRNHVYVAEEDPNAEKWLELKQMQEDKTIVKVKIKEAVKGGLVTFVEEMRAFIPASQISVEYVEKLEDWQGKYLETVIITVDPENKKLVLSGKALQKERLEAEKSKILAECKAGDIVAGTVDSLKPYGAFVKLDNGLSGLLHISQISSQRIKHPSAVLKEGQKITVKIISLTEGKLSLSMKALESDETGKAEEVFDYKEDANIVTDLGSLLKGWKL